MEVRIGIIGLGNMGFAHARCIHEGRVRGMRLCALCDTDPGKLKKAADAFGITAAFSDDRELTGSGLVDAVLIATPHPLHAEMAVRAFERGLHVLTEKPADVSVSAAQKMNEAAEKSGRVFGIMFNQRTNPLFRRARELVTGGRLGELKRSTWIVTNWYRTQGYYDSGDWRATWAGEGGGVLINQAPHNLDLWQWICGMPVGITAFCDTAKYHDIEVEDDVAIHARYANGATGTFLTSTGEFCGTNRLEVSGSLGKLVLEEGKLKFWQFGRDEREIRFDSGQDPGSVPVTCTEYLPEEKETGHRGILQNFADAILQGTPLLASGFEGIRSLSISNAAYLSQWSGNREVPLPLCAEAFDALLRERIRASAVQNAGKPRGKISPGNTADLREKNGVQDTADLREKPDAQDTAGFHGKPGTQEAAGGQPDGSYKKRWQVQW